MKKIRVSSVVAVLAASFCGVCNAGFVVEEPIDARPAAPVTGESSVDKVGAGLAQVGLPSGSQPKVHGMAKEIQLLTALKQIVPPGWKAKRAGGLDITQMVSWRGDGRSWLDVLQEVAVANGFSAMVDWSRQEVTVAPAGFSPTGNGLRPSSVVSKPVVEPQAKVWVLTPTMTLRENIEVWAKDSGWTLSWAAVDYPVTSKVSLTGSLDDASTGPLVQLAKAYETAAQPLTFTFYTNKVIRVENASYRQINVHDQLPNHRSMQ